MPSVETTVAMRTETPGNEGWARSARAGDPNKYFVVSADCHANEPKSWVKSRIDPAYLADDRDAALLLEGAKITRRIMEAPAFDAWRDDEIYTKGVEGDEAIMAHIRDRADTIYHPVGTCAMGAGEEAVTDPSLRVRGVAGLRVVDASVMPRLVGGNTNAPTIMIAEKAADMIRDGA